MRHSLAVLCSFLALSATMSTQGADPDALVKQGRSLMNQGKHDEAERLYRQALTLSPRSFDASSALGILLDLKGQYAEARSHFERAIEFAPAPSARNQALNAMALSFAFERKLPESEKYFELMRQQQKADGDFAGAAASARSLGRIYLENNDTVNGRRWYELGYEESKPRDDAPVTEKLLWELRSRHAQARIAAREGNMDTARKHLAEFETLMQKRGRQDEDNEIYKWLAGYVAYYGKNFDRAIAEFAGGNLADPFVLYMLGRSYEAKGDSQNARAYYERTLASNVHNLQASIARPQARERLATMRRAQSVTDSRRSPFGTRSPRVPPVGAGAGGGTA